MTIEVVKTENLRRICNHSHFDFETTADLDTIGSIIGQPRGTRAIEFGIDIRSQGYNIYILGDIGTGRTTAIRRFLREKSEETPSPDDWLYVHNFDTPHRPRALHFPPGQGAIFKAQMETLLKQLQKDLPQAFNTDAYQESASTIQRNFEKKRSELFEAFRYKAAGEDFALINTDSGLVLAPMAGDKALSPVEFNALPLDQRQAIQAKQETLGLELDEILQEISVLDEQMIQQMSQLNQQVATNALEPHFGRLQEAYPANEPVGTYLTSLQQDVLRSLPLFIPDPDTEEAPDENSWRRYQVNLMVDNSQTEGVPVIVESNPTYYNLIGRIEYESRYGVMTTDFTNLKAGSLHEANGGYLIINAHDLLRDPFAWQALKRAITNEQIRLQSLENQQGAQLLAKTLDPEPIPLTIKIILLGSADLYYSLYELEEDFSELFKVKADFSSTMPRNDENEYEYALFISNLCLEEGLHHFTSTAVEKVIEYGSRLAEDQDKLSTRFGIMADVIREASYWAGKRKRDIVIEEDVRYALNERIYRANLVEEQLQEEIDKGSILLSFSGEAVGQVNGLSVLDLGDHTCGRPGRITARTYMGKDGVVNIEREVDMAGPIHNKGLLILTGYLGGTYAQGQPLSLSASLTFEQNYGGIDGDSASSTELYALLSSIAQIPLKQGIAITGSVNQYGHIQPIGGVTEKIEGFFDVCRTRGLTGEQGVVIPAINKRNLMLREEVIEAVEAGEFHIWAIDTVDDGLELLTGQEAGQRGENGRYPPHTVHAAVQQRLLRLAQDLEAFGPDHGEDEEE